MPLIIEIADGVEAEVTDDGALEFPNYDIEHDIVLAEMGEERTRAVEFLERWKNHPFDVILGSIHSGKALIDIGAVFIEEVFYVLKKHNPDCLVIDITKDAPDVFSALKHWSHYLNDIPVRRHRYWAESTLTDAHDCYIRASKSWYYFGLREIRRNIYDAFHHLVKAMHECDISQKIINNTLHHLLVSAIKIAQEYD